MEKQQVKEMIEKITAETIDAFSDKNSADAILLSNDQRIILAINTMAEKIIMGIE